MAMKENPYGKGCAMTFPLELAEVREEEKQWDQSYLFPSETAELRKDIMETCDRMEYDGSPMFDAYPDRVTVEHMAEKICRQNAECMRGMDERWFRILAQVMLCHEMGCRRERRRCHKEHMGKCW